MTKKKATPASTFAELERERNRKNPLWNVFLHDSVPVNAALYDAGVGEFTLTREVEWATCLAPLHPQAMRTKLTFPMERMCDIPGALVKFAISQNMAFRLEPDSLKGWHKKYGAVFMPVGDRRLAEIASTPEVAYEIDGLSYECEVCRSTEGIELEPTRTAYYIPEPNRFQRILIELGDEPENPNQPSWLCRECAVEYHDHWNSQWREYYDSLL